MLNKSNEKKRNMEKKINLKTIDSLTVGAPKRTNVATDSNNNIYIVKNMKNSLNLLKHQQL